MLGFSTCMFFCVLYLYCGNRSLNCFTALPFITILFFLAGCMTVTSLLYEDNSEETFEESRRERTYSWSKFFLLPVLCSLFLSAVSDMPVLKGLSVKLFCL